MPLCFCKTLGVPLAGFELEDVIRQDLISSNAPEETVSLCLAAFPGQRGQQH